jgi:hypothetical protein
VKGSLQKLVAVLAILAIAGFFAYLSTSPAASHTEKEANRFFEVAGKGSHLLDALREAPRFHGIYFGDCAHIEKTGTAGEEKPIVFEPKEGKLVKFASVEKALESNLAMFRYPACRNVTVVYMEMFPYRGTVRVKLSEKGDVVEAKPPTFSI